MSNIVEFIVKMKDFMSGGLSRIGAASRSTFSQMSQHVNQVTQRNRVLGQVFNQIQARIRQVEQTIRSSTIPSVIAAARRQLQALQAQAARHTGSGIGSGGSGGSGQVPGVGGIALGSMLGNIATNIATAFLDVVKNGIGSAISGSMEKEKNITGLATFVGDKKAGQIYQNIRTDAENSSYDTSTLLKANRALISVDGNAENAREDVMNLANAISATGGGTDELQRMAINMQQIKSLGVASAMDIKQFGYAGINIYGLLAKATGKSADEVKKMDVSYDLLTKAFAMARMEGGLYAGALEKMNQTMSGKWESVKDRASNAMTDIGDAFAPIIVKVLDLAIKATEAIRPMLAQAQPYIAMISSGLGQAIDFILNIGTNMGIWSDYVATLMEYYEVVWRVLKGLFATIVKIITGIYDWVSQSILMRDIFKGIVFVMISIFEVIGWIGEKIGWIWDHVLRPFLDNLELVYRIIKDIMGFSEENTLKVEVQKTTKEEKPKAKPADYFSDLTRFKDAGAGGGENKKEKNKKKSKEVGDTIAGGGTKYITINLGKFFENIQFTTMNMNESTQEIEKIILECLGRTLYNGSKNM